MGQHLENNNIEIEKSTQHILNLAETIIARAQKAGATDAMVFINTDRGFSIDVRMNQVETVAFSEDKGINLITYFGERKGEACTTDTSAESIDKMITAACDIAKVSAADPCFGLPEAELLAKEQRDLDLYHPTTLSTQEAIEKALACEADALAMDKRITNSDGVNISTYTFCHGFLNTRGGLGIINSTRHSASCSFIATAENQMQRDYDYTTGRDFAELTPFTELAKKAVERSLKRLGAQQIKTQKAPVLFSARVASGLFLSFIQAISGSNLYRKNSFLLNCLGQQIFSANINIYEQPHILKGLGSASFDNEGVATRNNIFVKDGILDQYALNCYSARKLNMETTANCGGVHNLTIEPTAGDMPALLAQMDRGLLVTELMGQGVNILTGDYSRGASGFWVEKGKIKFPVENVTVAGNFKDMFQKVVAVGTDINPNISTRCGSVLIAEMMIAGN